MVPTEPRIYGHDPYRSGRDCDVDGDDSDGEVEIGRHREDALIDSARQGDSIALERLLRDNYERIYTLCRRMCANREQAEDATQNALIAIVRGLSGFDGRSKFSTWSYRVATNATLDEIRRSNRHHTVPLDRRFAAADEGTELTADHLGDKSQVDPGDLVVTAELRAELSSAVDSLDERFRVPLVLRDVADLDYGEIAERLGIPPGTVRSRISRGRRQLAAVLTALDREESGDVGNQSGEEFVLPEEP